MEKFRYNNITIEEVNNMTKATKVEYIRMLAIIKLNIEKKKTNKRNVNEYTRLLLNYSPRYLQNASIKDVDKAMDYLDNNQVLTMFNNIINKNNELMDIKNINIL